MKPHVLSKEIQFCFENNMTVWITELYYYIADQSKYTDTDIVNTLNVVQNVIPTTFEEMRSYCFQILNLTNVKENRKDVFRMLKNTPFNYVSKAETVFIAITICLAVKLLSKKEAFTKSFCNVDSEQHILLSAILSSHEESISKFFQKEGFSGPNTLNKR